MHAPEDGWSIEWPACGIDLGAAQLRRWADEQAGRAMPREAFRAWTERHGFTLDAAAEATGLPRDEIRRRNFVRPEQMPYKTQLGFEIDSGDFEGTMQMALDAAEWSGFEARRKEAARRTAFLQAFLEQLAREIGGEWTGLQGFPED